MAINPVNDISTRGRMRVSGRGRVGCHIAPGASMGGYCHIGDCAIIGIGANISASVRIGGSAILSVGSAVTRDVPDFAVVEGAPARIIGSRKGGGAGVSAVGSAMPG